MSAPPTVVWTEKYRPKSIADIKGHRKIKQLLENSVKAKCRGLPPLILYGPPGTGKTSLAMALAHDGRVWGGTGTPLVNRRRDLWVVLQAADLGRRVFGSFEEFERIFEGTHSVLDGKSELDVALGNVKDAGLTEEPPIGFDDKPEPDGSEPGDDDIPFS